MMRSVLFATSRSASFLGTTLLLLQLLTKTIHAEIDWGSIPEGLIVGPGVGNVNSTNDYCEVLRDASLELNDALRGRNLSVAVQYGPGFDFFQYDPDEDLSATNPSGMIASLLDDLAERAGFSWRYSFVAYDTNATYALHGSGLGKWDRMLKWTTENFDLSVDKWFQTTTRLESGIVFLHSWFDASLILVDQGDEVDFNWFGFAEPFDFWVWMAIIGTVFASAIFMMCIEALENRRENRSLSSWFGDHIYSSNLAFSQHFLYDYPRTGAGRIFLSTFAFWSLLIVSTYTANLASILVENVLSSSVDSIQGAMDKNLFICIHDGSASATIVNTLFPNFKNYENVVRASTPTQMYELLSSRKCDILVGTRQEYDILQNQEKYGCNLVQAGPEMHPASASFAIEFDPLRCDSVLAYVLNIHMHALTTDGSLGKYWDTYLSGLPQKCPTKDFWGNIEYSRRLEEIKGDDEAANGSAVAGRKLKGGGGGGGGGSGGGASVAVQGGNNDEFNQLKGMAGMFMVHAIGTVIALVLATYTQFHRKTIKAPRNRAKVEKMNLADLDVSDEDAELLKEQMLKDSRLRRQVSLRLSSRQSSLAASRQKIVSDYHPQNQHSIRRQNSIREQFSSPQTMPRIVDGDGQDDLYQQYESLKKDFESRMNLVKQEFTSQLDNLLSQHLHKHSSSARTDETKENVPLDNEESSIGSEIGNNSARRVNPAKTSIRRAGMDGSIDSVQVEPIDA